MKIVILVIGFYTILNARVLGLGGSIVNSLTQEELTTIIVVGVLIMFVLAILVNFFKRRSFMKRIEDFTRWLKDIHFLKDLVLRIIVVAIILYFAVLAYIFTIPILLYYLYKKYGNLEIAKKKDL